MKIPWLWFRKYPAVAVLLRWKNSVPTPGTLNMCTKKRQKKNQFVVFAYYGDLNRFEQSRVKTVFDATNAIK